MEQFLHEIDTFLSRYFFAERLINPFIPRVVDRGPPLDINIVTENVIRFIKSAFSNLTKLKDCYFIGSDALRQGARPCEQQRKGSLLISPKMAAAIGKYQQDTGIGSVF